MRGSLKQIDYFFSKNVDTRNKKVILFTDGKKLNFHYKEQHFLVEVIKDFENESENNIFRENGVLNARNEIVINESELKSFGSDNTCLI
jgi:hypothetical protein